MSTIKAFFKPAPRPEPAPAPEAKAPGFEVRLSRTSRVDAWDEHLFCDCRPSEAADNADETTSIAQRYDSTEASSWHDGFTLPEDFDRVYKTLDEANAAARSIVEKQLLEPVLGGCTRASQEDADACDGDLPHGYKVPTSDTKPTSDPPGAGGRASYSGRVSLFCDPYGSDVWTVVVTEFRARVVVEGDRSAPPGAVAKSKTSGAKAKKATPRGRPAGARAVAKPKPLSSTKTAATKSRKAAARRGGGARVLYTPGCGLSKKEVAAINKAGRKSRPRPRSGWCADLSD